jgi:hypothetical protein
MASTDGELVDTAEATPDDDEVMTVDEAIALGLASGLLLS